MNSNGRGLCSVKSSTEEETQSLQARQGGLDRHTKRAISLDDVSVDVTEIVRLPLEVANGIHRAEETAEEYLEERELEQAMVMDELTTHFMMSRQMNHLSISALPELKWVLVQRGRRREGRVDGNSTHPDNGGWLCGGYYAVLGDIASETDGDINMEECQSSGVSGNNYTWAQRGNQDGEHDCEALTQGASKRAGCTTSGKMRAACVSDDSESTGGEDDVWNMHRRYFHQATWSSADRFRRTARCDELQKILRSQLRRMSADRQSARVRFLRQLRHIFPGINLRQIPRWTRIRRALEEAWKAAKHRARGGSSKRSPATGSHRGSRNTPAPGTLRWMVAVVGTGLAKGWRCCLTCISAFLVAAMALSMSLVAISVRLRTQWVDAALAPGTGLRACLPPPAFTT